MDLFALRVCTWRPPSGQSYPFDVSPQPLADVDYGKNPFRQDTYPTTGLVRREREKLKGCVEIEAVREILRYRGVPITPPRLAPARGPPLWVAVGQFGADLLAQPIPKFEFDQWFGW